MDKIKNIQSGDEGIAPDREVTVAPVSLNPKINRRFLYSLGVNTVFEKNVVPQLSLGFSLNGWRHTGFFRAFDFPITYALTPECKGKVDLTQNHQALGAGGSFELVAVDGGTLRFSAMLEGHHGKGSFFGVPHFDAGAKILVAETALLGDVFVTLGYGFTPDILQFPQHNSKTAHGIETSVQFQLPAL